MYKKRQEASLYQETSISHTGSSSRSIRRRLAAIRSKVLSGGRLSASERQFLRKYAPELYSRYLVLERERQVEKERKEQRLRLERQEKEELKKKAVKKKRLEKERQKAAQERMRLERKREEETNNQIRACRKYHRPAFKGHPEISVLQPVLPGPDETLLGVVKVEIAGMPEAASLAIQVKRDLEEDRAATLWTDKREAQQAPNARQAEEGDGQEFFSPKPHGKEKQKTNMEWNETGRKNMEALQEAAEAQAAETRSSQGRAAYRAATERTAALAAADRKGCNQKA